MNIKMSDTNLHMSGKAWQIRARLREWSKHQITLQEFLSRQIGRKQRDKKFLRNCRPFPAHLRRL
ncbi:Z-ring formation inhibitor MciZ [Paenactinomyces guangxiensis]|uniref:Z-ring formation inhibitor MciZ n=1 Tax=Paenactinomyces guangxiensis TaxID=1490290 RepID=A0A7W1WS31_9BACL|nr:Z-ring formation inhibitor MciZ [Paenactinomyces guangxiensis]MBH8592123.1 Z-ring formation inhibitor MciZ [Paenactinomyces guangxiensis]